MSKFAIILGEPNSINTEILAKSLAVKKKCLIIGSYNLLKAQLKILKIKADLNKIMSLEDIYKLEKKLNILDVPLKFNNAFKVKAKDSSVYIKKCFNLAHKLCIQKKLKGFINCAVDKKKLFGNKSFGITEFLAKKTGIKNSEVMMIYNKKLSVVPLTTHIKIKNVSKSLKKVILKNKIATINKYYLRYFKKKPKIGILGLNPHNLEFKKNSEEIKIILPSIKELKKKYNVTGPISADTVFIKNIRKNYDIIVGMYHDQVLVPFKALFEFDAINITLGLPYIRVSPDHGIANDKKMLNISNPKSLNKCIEIVSSLVK